MWELPGMRCSDAVHAMKSILSGPRASHTLQNAPGCNRTMDSREGREIASAMLFGMSV